MSEQIDAFRDWDAAYVLGALDSDDRRAYERHLRSCPECTAALSELAGLPGILGKLNPEDAVPLLAGASPATMLAGVDDHLRGQEHAPGVVQRLAAITRRRRRRNRFIAFGASAAVVVLVALGGIGYALNRAPTAATVAMSAVHQSAVEARMTITPKAWGTRFDWSCTYDHTGSDWAPATSYDLVVTLKSGRQETVATWSSTADHAGGLTASSEIATRDIRSVEIRVTGATSPLLRENL